MRILPMEKQFKIMDAITKKRIDTVMPAIMKETGIDMWLILAGEYNEDPVFKTIAPGIVGNASRMTCIAFSLSGDDYEAVSINKPSKALSRFFKQLKYNSDTQWDAIVDYIKDRNPQKIGINISPLCGLTAGLSQALYEELKQAAGPELSGRLVSADDLCVRWLEHRMEEEIAMYPAVYEITTGVMKQAFSREVIIPGVTTTQEVEFWAMDQFRKLGLPCCFPPTVNLQRKGWGETMITGTIRHGDLLHYDAGIEYLGLCTDLQRLGYVLSPGETAAPEGIQKGFQEGRKFGYLAAQAFVEGRTGNEIFDAALKNAKDAGIEAKLYTHPIGKYCHAAGPTIGMYDKQEHIPGRGDNKLHKNTAYALEYNVACNVNEWDMQKVVFYLEETVVYVEDGSVRYLDEAYKNIILI